MASPSVSVPSGVLLALPWEHLLLHWPCYFSGELFCPFLLTFTLLCPCLTVGLSRAQQCICWTHLEPAVCDTRQPWTPPEEAVLAGPSTPQNFPIVPQKGSQNHAPQVLVNNPLVVGPPVPSKYLALDNKWCDGELFWHSLNSRYIGSILFRTHCEVLLQKKRKSSTLLFA